MTPKEGNVQDLKRLTLLIDRASKICGSDNQLAIKLGVSRQQISKWRAGSADAPPAHQEAMAEMVGVDPAVHLLAAAVEKTESEKVMELFAKLRAQSILIQRALA